MEKPPYPIVAERALAPVPSKRLWSRGPHGRGPDEVPRPTTGQRLVYHVRGEHVPDLTDLPLDAPTVVDASRVSVVDVTPRTEVVVVLTIPSQDATSFTLRVTFLCTVQDPIALVRSGAPAAVAVLSAYVKGHHRIFELGLDHVLSDINEVRRKLNAQLRAYVTVMPPECAGMAAELAGVEVLTPEELTKFQQSLRDERQRYTVDVERRRNEGLLDELSAGLELDREEVSQRRTRVMDTEQRTHEFEEFRRAAAVVDDDPIALLRLSYSRGEISAKDLADEVRRLRELEIAQDREDTRAKVDFDRERQRAAWDAGRVDRDREWEADRRREEWARDDRASEREVKRKELEAKLEVIRELAEHGHLDNANLRLDQVVNDMLGRDAVTSVEPGRDGDLPQLETGAEDGDGGVDGGVGGGFGGGFEDGKVRVEDAH